ncbi:hypothetical protein BJ878DRAFT_543891 [Calycina marina]|uniref:Uncharacterized protein n=1 Tax=Calycina marina TaxID=1763456 RepID=A0A9P7YZH4_9HELO|nr:hypothetical protein BJ878DRAFT_543891 [Calycina marina]
MVGVRMGVAGSDAAFEEAAEVRASFQEETPETFGGNWYLFTKNSFGQSLYGYTNPISSESVIQAEQELSRITQENDPFDGYLGFCGGASIAAQVMMRDLLAHPEEERLSHEVLRGLIDPFETRYLANGQSFISER